MFVELVAGAMNSGYCPAVAGIQPIAKLPPRAGALPLPPTTSMDIVSVGLTYIGAAVADVVHVVLPFVLQVSDELVQAHEAALWHI